MIQHPSLRLGRWAGAQRKSLWVVPNAYRSVILDMKPWAYYRLNEAGASGPGDMIDASPNNRHGTYDPLAVKSFQVPGAVEGDYAIEAWGGKTDRAVASIPNQEATEGYPRLNFAVAFWCKPPQAINVAARAVATSGTGGLSDDMRWIMYPQHGETVSSGQNWAGFGVAVGTDGICTAEHTGLYFPVRSLLEAPLSGWIFCVVNVQQGQVSSTLNDPMERHRIFVNGVYGADFTPKTRYEESPDNEINPFVSDNLAHGILRDTYGSGFTGPIDEFAIFNRVLTQAEITEIYEAQRYTPLSDPVPEEPAETSALWVCQ